MAHPPSRKTQPQRKPASSLTASSGSNTGDTHKRSKRLSQKDMDPPADPTLPLSFGKYVGKTLAEIQVLDHSYLDWLVKNDVRGLGKAATILLKSTASPVRHTIPEFPTETAHKSSPASKRTLVRSSSTLGTDDKRTVASSKRDSSASRSPKPRRNSKRQPGQWKDKRDATNGNASLRIQLEDMTPLTGAELAALGSLGLELGRVQDLIGRKRWEPTPLFFLRNVRNKLRHGFPLNPAQLTYLARLEQQGHVSTAATPALIQLRHDDEAPANLAMPAPD